jgi:FMN reductase
MTPRTAVVVGNPKPGSRTLAAASFVAGALTGQDPDLVVDLATLGPALLDWQDPTVARLVADVGAADLVVVASPTFKATYTGLLKLFLDRFPTGVGLQGVAVPLMLGAAEPRARTGAPPAAAAGRARRSVPTAALYVLDREHDRPESYEGWLGGSRPLVHALLTRTSGVPA